MTVEQVKRVLFQPGGPGDEFLQAVALDSRVGVRRAYELYLRQRAAEERERQRLEGLFKHELDLWSRGVFPVAGVDEAGRGPLAGPVVAAAVILPGWVELSGLDDSKKVPASRRERLAAEIKDKALDWAVGLATVSEIYRYNIHRASLLAMLRAVNSLSKRPHHVLVDGFAIPGLGIAQTPLKGGDRCSASIAAASIIAKVTRDQLMDICHQLYPHYGFNKHRGYPTAAHLEALSVYGPCPVHRWGFLPVKDLSKR